MRIRLSLVLVVLLAFAAVWGAAVISGLASSGASANGEIAKAVIAREKASAAAWKNKDKAFFADFLAEDATYFGWMSPYLETDPKENFLPKFEQIAEMMKIIDFQMYNPRVQVYGDMAVLTYNAASTISMGGQTMNYTCKMTSVYVKQGNTWRVVHGHESMNPGAR